jgi:hypothetical protein
MDMNATEALPIGIKKPWLVFKYWTYNAKFCNISSNIWPRMLLWGMVLQESTSSLNYRLRNSALEMTISQINSAKFSKSLTLWLGFVVTEVNYRALSSRSFWFSCEQSQDSKYPDKCCDTRKASFKQKMFNMSFGEDWRPKESLNRREAFQREGTTVYFLYICLCS